MTGLSDIFEKINHFKAIQQNMLLDFRGVDSPKNLQKKSKKRICMRQKPPYYNPPEKIHPLNELTPDLRQAVASSHLPSAGLAVFAREEAVWRRPGSACEELGSWGFSVFF